MKYDVFSIIAIMGVVQGFFLSSNLLIPSKKATYTYSKLFLGLLILFLCLYCIDSILTVTKEFYNYPHFFAVKDPLILLCGPLIFLYITSLIKPNFQLRRVHLLHLIPFVFFLFRIAPLYFKSAGYKKRVLDHMYSNYTAVRDVEINFLFNLHIFLYLVVTLVVLFRIYRINKLQKPPFLRKDLKQIAIIVLIVFAVYTVNVIRFWLSYNAETVLWTPLIIALLFFIIGYRSLQIDGVVTTNSDVLSKEKIAQFTALIEALDRQVLENKLYLDPKLNLDSTALFLHTNRQYLSNAINEVKGMSFNKYVNKSRINAAKSMLSSAEHELYSLEKIAEDAGFNSFSTFQRAFKEFEGVSAAKYRLQKNVNL